MFKVLTITLLLLASLFATTANAQDEVGKPYIKNFNSKKYNFSETVWDITQDQRGLMYFGISTGIVRFDGTNSITIPVDNGSTVRALDIDTNGIIYVGAKGEFGYLSEDSLGYPIYKSLSENLEEKYKNFADVWNIYATKRGIFFYSFDRIFKWHNNQFTIYEYEDITAHLGFYVDDNIYLVRLKTGLCYYQNNDFVLVPGGDYFKGKTVFSVLPYGDNEVIVATRSEGLEILNIQTGEIKPFENQANDGLKEGRIYHGALSENGDYIIGTLNNGIYVINKKGELLNHISQKNGLQSNNIKYIFKDKDGGIWLGNGMGLSYVELNLPLTFFDTDNNIKGKIRDVIRFKDEFYIATENSVYYLDKSEKDLKNKFKKIENADNQFWCFLKAGDKLLVGSDGFFEIKDKKIVRLNGLDGNAVFSMLQSEKHPDLIFLATKGGLVVAEILPNREVKIAHQFKKLDVECNFLAEDVGGNLWMSTAFNFILKVEASSFNKDAGFPLSYKQYEYSEKLASEQVIKFKNEVLFSSTKGLLKNKNEQFEQAQPIVINGMPDNFMVRELIESKNGDLWIHYHAGSKYTGVFLASKNKDGTYQFQQNPFTRINEKISHVKAPFIDDKGIVWFYGSEEVVRYDATKGNNKQTSYYANISRVSLKSDSIIGFKGIANTPQLNFKNNALTFTFSAATYGNEDEIYYQHFLIGEDTTWSDWTTLNTKEYNFLHEGEYTFKVRAKNVYNQISEEDEFTFTILPPWYREAWAYIVYLLGFIILIIVIIKIATYRLNKSKRKLELTVKERTKDIVVEKEKVEQQKSELEYIHSELSERNKDVMDSIKYAQRIQSSILPSIDKLKQEFHESFVFYQPRDIVSGDFYWYQKVGDFFIIACADCTGHGVPGAFMSMIGTTLLNKIVEQDNVARCEDALTELDIELQKTLQQKKGELEDEIVMDGMDISLIAVNLKTSECHYSGANRPLYLIRNKELIVFDSNRMSIGGGFTKNKEFKGKSIEILTGDQLYMFTDGVVDQFGGEKNKKFKRERLKQLLLEICDLTMEGQSKQIQTSFQKWKGGNEQIDDVLIMGVKIP